MIMLYEGNKAEQESAANNNWLIEESSAKHIVSNELLFLIIYVYRSKS